PAGDQHRGDVGHAEALADDRHGPDAAAHDADDAAGVRRDDGVLPGRPGAVLGHQRRPRPAAAVVHAQEVRRPRAGQGLTGATMQDEARLPAGFFLVLLQCRWSWPGGRWPGGRKLDGLAAEVPPCGGLLLESVPGARTRRPSGAQTAMSPSWTTSPSQG